MISGRSLKSFLIFLSWLLAWFGQVDAKSYSGKRNHTIERRQSTSSYWVANIKRQGTIAYGTNATYRLWRNVKDYGATGDGVTDDTAAINAAIADGQRCGGGCDSTTLTIALVYFPPGTYMISTPIIMYYYTELVGDALNLPVIKALPSFFGIGLLDSDVYYPGGANWYTNQNNFYRKVRNFILDITLMPVNRGACIHWQVAQATSLQNIVFNMKPPSADNKQQGIFMDNGSGGWMSDLVFNGGNIAAFMGNQQFTARNFTFNNCNTAIYQNWGWVWNYKSLTINNCSIGIDLTQGGGTVQTVGSVIAQDAIFNNVDIGVLTTWSGNSTPVAGGTFVCDNCDFRTTNLSIAYPNRTVIVPGGSIVQSFLQGRVYTVFDGASQDGAGQTCYQPTTTSSREQILANAPPKPAGLLDSNGHIFGRSKPQYEHVPVTSFVSVKDHGAKGDGITDDTAAIQSILNSVTTDQVVYFDHGAYIISDTIQVPPNIKITGEIWPIIMVNGSAFNDMNNPKAVWRVGNPGDACNVEMSDLVFELRRPGVGAIVVEWNCAQASPGSAGMWDVHWRIGGTAGTLLQSDICTKDPKVEAPSNPACWAAFLLMHVTSQGSIYMENNWGWVADHELDRPDHNQINIYNGRGILIESSKPTWLYGTSFEHSTIYNYHVANAMNVYMGVIQSETAYMQENPNSLDPFPPDSRYSDPDFSNCYQAICFKTLGLRIYNSTYVLNYGAGLYSFFNNYDQGCLLDEACQENMVEIKESEALYLYALSTKASQFMATVDNVGLSPALANLDTFCSTDAVFEYP